MYCSAASAGKKANPVFVREGNKNSAENSSAQKKDEKSHVTTEQKASVQNTAASLLGCPKCNKKIETSDLQTHLFDHYQEHWKKKVGEIV